MDYMFLYNANSFVQLKNEAFMNSRDDNGQVTKEDISTSQSLLSSWGHILKHCLKTYPADAINCDNKYKDFERQKSMLEAQEEHYLAPLSRSIKSKREQFDKAFDHRHENGYTPIEKLSKESQALKKEIKEDVDQIVETKRQFESFRNKVLKNTVHTAPNYYGFNIDWSRKFANKEINTMLNKDLQDSCESLAHIDQCISENKSAPYVSTLEMFNDQLKMLKR